jgi:hypothetical protein
MICGFFSKIQNKFKQALTVSKLSYSDLLCTRPSSQEVISFERAVSVLLCGVGQNQLEPLYGAWAGSEALWTTYKKGTGWSPFCPQSNEPFLVVSLHQGIPGST